MSIDVCRVPLLMLLKAVFTSLDHILIMPLKCGLLIKTGDEAHGWE